MSGPIKTISPFYLPMPVALTGVAGEDVRANTNSSGAGADVEIVGGITDLETSTGQFTIGRTGLFSAGPVPLLSLFGKMDSARPVQRWKPAIAIAERTIINAVVTNRNGEGAGNLVFIGQQPKHRGQDVPESRLGMRAVVPIDSQFGGVASELKSNQLQPFNTDFLLEGFLSDLALVTVRVMGAYSEFWSRDFIPVWALAGKTASALPIQKLQDCYFIPAGGSISVEFLNDAVAPEASGILWAVGRALV